MGSISLKTLYNDGHGGAAITLSMDLVQVVVDGEGRRWLRLRSCYPRADAPFVSDQEASTAVLRR